MIPKNWVAVSEVLYLLANHIDVFVGKSAFHGPSFPGTDYNTQVAQFQGAESALLARLTIPIDWLYWKLSPPKVVLGMYGWPVWVVCDVLQQGRKPDLSCNCILRYNLDCSLEDRQSKRDFVNIRCRFRQCSMRQRNIQCHV